MITKVRESKEKMRRERKIQGKERKKDMRCEVERRGMSRCAKRRIEAKRIGEEGVRGDVGRGGRIRGCSIRRGRLSDEEMKSIAERWRRGGVRRGMKCMACRVGRWKGEPLVKRIRR